jgi:YcxB-like protein
LTLHYTITKEDYVSYYTYMYWDEPSRKRKRINNILKQVGIFSLVVSILFFSKVNIFINIFSLPVFVILLISTFLPLLTGRSLMVKQANGLADNPDNESIFKEVMLNANDEKLFVKSTLIEAVYNWKAFIKKTETEKYYYLFQNSMQAIIIPKRAFINNEEKIAFDKILSRNLSLDAEIKDAL